MHWCTLLFKSYWTYFYTGRSNHNSPEHTAQSEPMTQWSYNVCLWRTDNFYCILTSASASYLDEVIWLAVVLEISHRRLRMNLIEYCVKLWVIRGIACSLTALKKRSQPPSSSGQGKISWPWAGGLDLTLSLFCCCQGGTGLTDHCSDLFGTSDFLCLLREWTLGLVLSWKTTVRVSLQALRLISHKEKTGQGESESGYSGNIPG